MPAIYGMIEAPVRDAYRVTARAVRAELEREAFVRRRYDELVHNLTAATVRPLAVEPGGWCPAFCRVDHDVRLDMAYWIEQTADDVTDVLRRLLFLDAGIHRELCEQYALAKAGDEASRRSIDDGLEAA